MICVCKAYNYSFRTLSRFWARTSFFCFKNLHRINILINLIASMSKLVSPFINKNLNNKTILIFIWSSKIWYSLLGYFLYEIVKFNYFFFIRNILYYRTLLNLYLYFFANVTMNIKHSWVLIFNEMVFFLHKNLKIFLVRFY